MKKLLLTILLLLNTTNLLAVSEDTQILIELIKANQKSNDKRFDSIDKRFDDVNKRFDDVNKRFDDVNKRFESMQKQMDRRFEDMQKQMDRRATEAHDLSMNIIYAIASLFGFIIWDRRTMINSAKKETIRELEPELVKKADKNMLNEIIAIIEEMAKKDKEVEKILLKHHLSLV